jgi:hypothetical protein
MRLGLLLASAAASDFTISGRHVSVTVSITANATFVSALSLAFIDGTLCAESGRAATRNLLLPWADADALQASRTGLAEGTGRWFGSSGGTVAAHTPSSITITGIAVGAVAVETWLLTVDAPDSLAWFVNRTFLASTAVTADRQPSLCVAAPLGTGPEPQPGDCGGNLARDLCAQNQLFSFFDSELAVDTAFDTGFALPPSAPPAAAPWAEAVSPRCAQTLRLSPSGLALDVVASAGSGAPFSWSKSGLVGASTCFGATGVDRRARNARTAAAGDVWTSSLRLVSLRVDDGIAPLKLSLGAANADIVAAARRFVISHGLASGWVFANSPTSVTCLHELSVFPLMLSVLGAPPSDGRVTWLDAFEAQLRYFAPHVNASGFLYNRWDLLGDEQHTAHDASSMFGCISDQVPHYILAAYEFAVASGRASTIADLLPALRSLGSYLLDPLGMRADGVATIRCTHGVSRAEQPDARPSNWWDTLPFGHLDGLVNAYAVRALWALSEMELWAGNATAGAEYADLHASAVVAYNKVFWRARRSGGGGELLGHWVDWIDVNGRSREYGFVWHNALAAGYSRIANASQMAAYAADAAAAEAVLAARYNVSMDTFFAAPANLIPAAPEDLLYCNAAQPIDTVFPFYENGDQFLVVAGYEWVAAARAGNSDSVLSRLRLAMAEYNRTAFFGQNRDWLADGGVGQMMGGDILTDQLLLLWGGLRAVFGIEPTLRQGIVTTNAPASGLEGAWHAFLHLGQEMNVTITSGGVVRMVRASAGP